MSKYTKMVLVPQSLLESTMRQNEERANPIVDQLVSLDKQMESTMRNSNLSAEERIEKYLQTMREHGIYKQQFKDENKDTAAVVHHVPEQTTLTSDHLLQSLPVSFRPRAARILTRIAASADHEIDWNTQRLIFRSTPLPESNIKTLLHDALSTSKNKPKHISGREELQNLVGGLKRTTSTKETSAAKVPRWDQ
jgi:histidinol-phosphate/aromatic aminotransferase/cobyric acid decarboxylase-like protein